MTVEQAMYGTGWAKCARCGVKNRAEEQLELEGADKSKMVVCKNADRCERWKADLARATVDDLARLAR